MNINDFSKKRRKKYFFCVLLILCFVLAALSGCDKTSGDNEIVGINPPTPKPSLSLSVSRDITGIYCGDNFTIGRASSGDIMFTGNCAGIYRELSKLQNTQAIYCGRGVAAGINSDGSITLIGAGKELYADALSWQNMVSLSFGNNFLIGLCSDGTLKACGDNTFSQCEVEGIEGVIKISAASGRFAALFADGSVKTYGLLSTRDTANSWTGIKDIACSDLFTLGIKENGDVVSYNNDSAAAWQGAESVCAYGTLAAAVLNDGTVVCTKEYKGLDDIKNARAISMGDGFLCALRETGSVKSFGKSGDMQTATQHWELLPVYDEKTGYVTGFAKETPISTAEEYLKIEFKDEVTICKKNGEAVTGDFAGTGMYVKDSSGEMRARILIYGDVTGDGRIDEADKEKLSSHIDGNNELKGIYLEAADTQHYRSGNKTLNVADINNISGEKSGTAHITQHFYDPYNESLDKWYSVNSDTVGYIRLHGTNIDYPIMYGDNFYYNELTPYKRHSTIGSIYAFYNSYQKNNVIMGHNARVSGTMFHELHKIQNNKKALYTFKNRVYGITIYNEYSLWELFAMYETGPNEPNETQINNYQSMDGWNDDQINAWIAGQIERSEVDFKTDVSADDTFITMYTCGDYYYYDRTNQARLYLFFRRIG